MDRGFLCGDGLFETLCVANGKFSRWLASRPLNSHGNGETARRGSGAGSFEHQPQGVEDARNHK